jgi:hypothetical protein
MNEVDTDLDFLSDDELAEILAIESDLGVDISLDEIEYEVAGYAMGYDVDDEDEDEYSDWAE